MCCHVSAGRGALPLQNHQVQILTELCREKGVGPTCGFVASPEGPLSVPYRPGTPHTCSKSGLRIGRASTCRHMALSFGSRLPAREGSGATTCPAALDPASQLGKAPLLPCVMWLRTLPHCSGGLQCCRMFHVSGPCYPAQEGSEGDVCPMAPADQTLWTKSYSG
jgi:hypothetical protein